ncbi:MAG: YdbL family protein [Phenylobacterium sp.]|uniref:YdbL family protein n=1 Tax=Phenylobacterium sp. TaxID=1871053 RepID=UPI0039189787
MTFERLLAPVAVAVGTLTLAGAAFADPAAAKAAVDAAKAQGTVGEQNDGFLGFVRPSSDAALNAAVAEINAGRRQLYAQAAARNNVTPAAAGASAFNTVVQDRLKPGEYYQNAAGAWVRK